MLAKFASRSVPKVVAISCAVAASAVASTAALAQSVPAPSPTPAPAAARPTADEVACRKAALKFLEDTIAGDMAEDTVIPPEDAAHRKEYDAIRAFAAAYKRLDTALAGSKYAAEAKAWRDRRAKERAQAANCVRAAKVVVSGDTARVEMRNVPATAAPALQSPTSPARDRTLVLVKRGDRWLVDADRSGQLTGDAYQISKADAFISAADAVAEEIRKERLQSPFSPQELFDKKLLKLGFQRGLKDAVDDAPAMSGPSVSAKPAPVPKSPEKPATPAPAVTTNAPRNDEDACRAVVARVLRGFAFDGLDEKDIAPIADPAHREMFDTIQSVSAANMRMLNALRNAGFAEKADEMKAEFDGLLRECEADIRGSTVNISGDTAKVSMTIKRPESAAGKGERTYSVRRIDGRWRVDAVESKLTDGNPKVIEYLGEVVSATEEVIADLKAKRVVEPFHAETLVEKKMMERAMRKAFEDAAAGKKKDASKPEEPDEDDEPAKPAGPPPGEIRRWTLDGTGRSMYLIPDTALVVTGATRTPDSVHLWNLKLGSKLRSFKQEGVEFHAIAVAAARGGALIVAGGEAFDPAEVADARKDPACRNPYEQAGATDYDVRIWDGRTGKLLRTLKGHTGAVMTVDVSPDGKLVASGGHDSAARVWNLDTGELLKTIKMSNTYTPVLGVRFSRDGGELAVGTNEDKGSVTLYDTQSWDKVAQHDQERNTGTVEFSPDDKWTACVRLGVVVIYSRENDSKRVLACLSSATQATRINSVAFSEDGRYAVTSEGIEKAKGALVGMVFDLTPRIRVFDVATSEQIAMFTGIEDAVWSAAFTQDGKAIVSCSADGTLRLWELPEVMKK